MTKEELEKEAIKCMHEIKYWIRVPIKKETEKDGISEILKLTEPREKRIADLEKENERITTKYYELQETLKKVRIALIQERTANIMNYGKGGVEMFDNMFEILKGVSN